MYAIEDKKEGNKKKKVIKHPKIHVYPKKLIKTTDGFREKLKSVFSYRIILIDTLGKNTSSIFEGRICSLCHHGLFFADCFHKNDNLRVSFFRFCHYCKTLFILSGRFESEVAFDESFRFFERSIYSKKKKRIANE